MQIKATLICTGLFGESLYRDVYIAVRLKTEHYRNNCFFLPTLPPQKTQLISWAHLEFTNSYSIRY